MENSRNLALAFIFKKFGSNWRREAEAEAEADALQFQKLKGEGKNALELTAICFYFSCFFRDHALFTWTKKIEHDQFFCLIFWKKIPDRDTILNYSQSETAMYEWSVRRSYERVDSTVVFYSVPHKAMIWIVLWSIM